MAFKTGYRIDQSKLNPQLRLLPFWGGEFSSFKDRPEIRPRPPIS